HEPPGLTKGDEERVVWTCLHRDHGVTIGTSDTPLERASDVASCGHNGDADGNPGASRRADGGDSARTRGRDDRGDARRHSGRVADADPGEQARPSDRVRT